MSKGNTFETDLLGLIFNATAIANVADNAATSPLTQLQVALHTADPGEAGSQTTSEATYTGYARVAVNRNSGGFTVSGNNVVNAATITFGACTAGSNSITHWSVGTASSGAGKILYKGPVGPIASLAEFTSDTGQIATGTMTVLPALSLAVDDRISFYATPAATLPTGLTEGTVYFVKTVSGNTITIATTSGGAAVTFSAVGSGLIFKHSVLAVSSGITPSFAAGQLKIFEE